MTGFEYLFGQREDRNGETGSDNRLQVSTMVKFSDLESIPLPTV